MGAADQTLSGTGECSAVRKTQLGPAPFCVPGPNFPSEEPERVPPLFSKGGGFGAKPWFGRSKTPGISAACRISPRGSWKKKGKRFGRGFLYPGPGFREPRIAGGRAGTGYTAFSSWKYPRKCAQRISPSRPGVPGQEGGSLRFLRQAVPGRVRHQLAGPQKLSDDGGAEPSLIDGDPGHKLPLGHDHILAGQAVQG